MKKPPDNPEFARFTEAMRHIMTVPKSAIVEQDKGKKKGKRLKASPASRDSVSSPKAAN